MRILVTGRDGQVAQSLAECVTDDELVFAARPDLDLADPKSVEDAILTIGPDVIVSAAAYTAVDRAEDEPGVAMAVNGRAPGVIGHAAARIGAAVIHLSTDYVFDGSLDRPWREDDPVGPLGVYGRTKLAGEQALAATGARHAILRTAWVYSPFGANFVKTMLRLAADRDIVRVVDDQIGSPTAAADIAAGIMAVIAGWRVGAASDREGIFHLAGAGTASWADLASATFAASRRLGGPSAAVEGIASRDYPTRAARPANSRLDTRRFRDAFDHVPPDWQRSLDRVVARLVG